jgi:hypothetical protein
MLFSYGRVAIFTATSLFVLTLGVARVYAQGQSGSIAGIVRDTSGAVLPGVTVEAASPALIEKVRTVVTDGQGQYKIVDLRPGTYSVTFTLTGFSAVRREQVELTMRKRAATLALLINRRAGSLRHSSISRRPLG